MMYDDKIVDFSSDYIEYIIDQYVHSKRDRTILKQKWLDDETYHTIAENVGMSDRGVQYVVDRWRKKLLKYFS